MVPIRAHPLLALTVAGGGSCLFALTGCAPIMSLAGSSGSGVVLATQLDRVKLLADGVSYAQTGKTLSDRALSNVAGANCSTFNVAFGRPVCSSAIPRAAPIEERDPSKAVNARAPLAASGRTGTGVQQTSSRDALRAPALAAGVAR
jgi:hypothetical protein